jgi:hypothetical protein
VAAVQAAYAAKAARDLAIKEKRAFESFVLVLAQARTTEALTVVR